MPEVLLRIRDLSTTSDPTGLSFPVDGASLGSGPSERITAEDLATWVGTQLPPATPGGSDTQVQFNNSGAFGGSANLTWASNQLVITSADLRFKDAATGILFDATTTGGGSTLRPQSNIVSSWNSSNDATRRGNLALSVYHGATAEVVFDAHATTGTVEVGIGGHVAVARGGLHLRWPPAHLEPHRALPKAERLGTDEEARGFLVFHEQIWLEQNVRGTPRRIR